MLRLLFFSSLVILFAAPLYHILKRRIDRIREELESEPDSLDERLDALTRNRKNLESDCKKEILDANRRAKAAETIQTKLAKQTQQTGERQ